MIVLFYRYCTDVLLFLIFFRVNFWDAYLTKNKILVYSIQNN